MKFHWLFRKAVCRPDELPAFVRSVEDVRGVRVMRLQGDVGKAIGGQVEEELETTEQREGFDHPLLMDFAATTGVDFSTVSYLVQALRKRMGTGARVGLLHAPPELISELELAKLEPLFTVFASEEEAMAKWSEGQ